MSENEKKKPTVGGIIKKILSAIVTVFIILCVAVCAIVMIKKATGKETSILGFRVFYVVTGSMDPTIPAGAAILTHAQDSYEVGDIISFVSKDSQIYGQTNTHRIVAETTVNGQKAFITRGDANNAEDSLPVYESQIYGRVVAHTGALTWLGTLIGFIMEPLGFVVIIIIPVMALIGIFIRDLAKQTKEVQKKETDELSSKEELLKKTEAEIAALQKQLAGPQDS